MAVVLIWASLGVLLGLAIALLLEVRRPGPPNYDP